MSEPLSYDGSYLRFNGDGTQAIAESLADF